MTESGQGATGAVQAWIKTARPHQYAKNFLVFVPLLTAHEYSTPALIGSLGALVAFSLCASAGYVVNDLIDAEADREHPTKRFRPIAAGKLPRLQAIAGAGVLLAAALALSASVSSSLLLVVASYFVISAAYSLWLKRWLMFDVVVLAALYTARVVAGAVAVGLAPSEWLLAFSMFVFICLALVKRYSELALRIDRGLPEAANRGYRLVDLPVVGAMAVASGFNAVTIFSLYVSSPAVRGLYNQPVLLWLICPILVYWLGRMMLLAHRRGIGDDPVLFALRDWPSLIAGALTVTIVVAAGL